MASTDDTGKKAVAKATVAKKAVAKKAVAKKTVADSAPKPISIDTDALLTSAIDLSFIPNFDASAAPDADASAAPSTPVVKKLRSATRVVLTIVGGIVMVALVLWAKSNGPANGNPAGAIATPSASTSAPVSLPTESTTPTSTPTPTTTPTTILAGYEEPREVVAQYTSAGATIYWKPPTATENLTGYNLEISANGGKWEILSKVPVTKQSFTVTKNNAAGWTSFRVSSVYADNQTFAAKPFGLPGTYS